MKIFQSLLHVLLVTFGATMALAQTPAASPSYFGATTGAATSSGGAAPSPGNPPGKPTVMDSAVQKELQQLTERHSAEVAAAALPVNQRFQAALQELLKRARESGDAQTVSKIEGLLNVSDNSLDRTVWQQNGNAWVKELRFNRGSMTVVPRRGNGVHSTGYKMRDGVVKFRWDGGEQQIIVAPDHASIAWGGIVFEPQ